MSKIILASQSPRRKELLSLANIDYTVQVANTDETYPDGLSFEAIATHIATEKAEKIALQNTEAIVIAADTIVICNNAILGKPMDEADAINMLTQLSGNTHTVITGVCILNGEQKIQFADSTVVSFHNITKQQITYYVNKYKPFDKAGAYAIQEWIGAIGIKKIEGDFYNVMGLPISRVVQELERLGV
jgi:septum formation protein